VISDNFKFVGGDMTKTEPIVGKPILTSLNAFSGLFQNNYDYVFHNGKNINGDVATTWKV